MPELPEVEIVKQSLSKKIEQKKIKKVIIKNRNLRFKIPIKFEKLLQNKTIKKVTRFSKYLILNFDDDSFCLIHLGMSGTIHLTKKNVLNKFTNTSFYNSPELPKKHNHVEIQFGDINVIYNDPRRFGFFKFIENKQALIKRFSHLGPEPFSKNFNLKYILNYFIDKKKDIKSFLFLKMYKHSHIQDWSEKSKQIINKIFTYYMNNYPKIAIKFNNNYSKERNISDYISGMTDKYAIDLYNSTK